MQFRETLRTLSESNTILTKSKPEVQETLICSKSREDTAESPPFPQEFTNRKDCLRILRVKRQLKGLDTSVVDLPEGIKIFINESLCPYYRGIWKIYKKLRDKQKVYQYLQ